MFRLASTDPGVRQQLLPPPGTRRTFRAPDGGELTYPPGTIPQTGPVAVAGGRDGGVRLIVSRGRSSSPDGRVRELFGCGELSFAGTHELLDFLSDPVLRPDPVVGDEATPEETAIAATAAAIAGRERPATQRQLHLMMASRIVGQAAALEELTRGVALHLRKRNPAAPYSALLLGTTGVGKTSIARLLPDALGVDPYGDAWRFAQFDCGEITGVDQLNRVIGAAPGYVGHQNGSPLADALAGGQAVLVFDEVEKAHPALLGSVVLALLDQGRVSTVGGARGEPRTVDARRSIVIFTSNLGVDELPRVTLDDRQARQHLRRHGLRPELVGRLDDVLHLATLGSDALLEAGRSIITETLAQFDLAPSWVNPEVIRFAMAAADRRSGARGVRAALERLLAPSLSDHLDSHPDGGSVRLDLDGNGRIALTS